MNNEPISFSDTFINEQYDFLTQKNMKFYIIDINKGPTFVGMTPKATDDYKIMKEKFGNSLTYINSCYGKSDYVSKVSACKQKYIRSTDSNDTNNIEFFAHFYNKYPDFRKILLKEFWNYIPEFENQQSRIFNMMEYLGVDKNKKQLASFIVSFPISALEAHTVKMQDLVLYLENKSFTNEEIDKTLFSFLKSRKNQLKDPYVGLAIKEFLLERNNYNENQVSQYFEFFPILKAHFEKPKIDYVIQKSQYNFNVCVSFDKLKKSFLIDKWETSDYEQHMPTILCAIEKQYKLVEAKVNNTNKTAKTADLLILHNDENYSIHNFTNTLTEVFSYLRDDPNYKVTTENILIFLHQKELTKKINKEFPIQENSIKKYKI